MALFGLFDRDSRQRAKPTQIAGKPGTSLIGGRITSQETDPRLTDMQKYRIFSDALLNVSIVSASVQHITKIMGAAKWTWEPSEADTEGEWAEVIKRILTEDPDQPWSEIVKAASTYALYGFAILEWTAVKRDDGVLTMGEIAARPQATIDQWDRQKGKLQGVVQRIPDTGEEAYIPRWKMLYIKDGSVTDSPAGLGVFRQLIPAVRRLNAYLDILHVGFDGDLRGTPVGRVPFIELYKSVNAGEITQEQMDETVDTVHSYVSDRSKKKPATGIVLDSSVYTSMDAAGRPSTTPMFDVTLLKGGTDSIPDILKMIEATRLEIAQVLGTELIMLGSGHGSYALSEDKASRLALSIDDTLGTIGHMVNKDLIDPIWIMNGFPPEMKPTARVEASKYITIESIAETLNKLKGLNQSDPAINEIRGKLGVSPLTDEAILDDPQSGEEDES